MGDADGRERKMKKEMRRRRWWREEGEDRNSEDVMREWKQEARDTDRLAKH